MISLPISEVLEYDENGHLSFWNSNCVVSANELFINNLVRIKYLILFFFIILVNQILSYCTVLEDKATVRAF